MATTLAEVVSFAESRPTERVFIEVTVMILADLPHPVNAPQRPRGYMFVSTHVSSTGQILRYTPVQPGTRLTPPRRASLAGDVDVLNNRATTGPGYDRQSFLVTEPARERWYLDLRFGPRRPPTPELVFADAPPEIVVRPPGSDAAFTFPLVQDGAFLRGQADGFVQATSATHIVVLLGELGVETVLR
jgi:hypothetical protein